MYGTNGNASHAVLSTPSEFLPLFAAAMLNKTQFYTIDLNGIVRFVNRDAEELLQIDAADIVGKPFVDLLSDDEINQSLSKNEFKVIAIGSVQTFRCVFKRANEKTKPQQLWCYMAGDSSKPLGLIIMAVDECNTKPAGIHIEHAGVEEALQLSNTLTTAERAVVDLVVDGEMNKSMARMLGVAVRTIEARRARAMLKLKVRSLPELVKTWMLVRAMEPIQSSEQVLRSNEASSTS